MICRFGDTNALSAATVPRICKTETGNMADEIPSDMFPVFLSILSLKKAKCRAAQRRPAKSKRKKRALFPRNDRPYVLGCETLQTEKALERFNFEKAETQSNGECRPKRATHKGRPSPSRNGLFTRLETGASFPHEREEKSSPVRRFSASAAARPHLCRWPSAPRCLIRLTPSASAADAAMARARRRSRTPAGRTERRSRRGHHPGHRPGKVRADAPHDTRRTGYSPIKKPLSALSQKGSTGVQGV